MLRPSVGVVAHRRTLLLTRSLCTKTTDNKSADKATSSTDFRRHLFRLAYPERQRFAGGLLLLAGSSSVSVVFPRVMGMVMDSALAGGADAWSPGAAAGALLGLFGVQSIMVAVRGRILSVAGERIAARLRRETFSSLLLRHDMAFFDRTRSGELQSRLISDCSSLQKLVVQDTVGALRAGLLATGSSLAMLSISPSLLGVSLLSFPPAVIVARRMGERMRERQKEVQDLLGEAGAEADRALSSIRTLKLFAAEEEALSRYGEKVETAKSKAEEVGAASALSEAGVGLALQSSALLVLAVGGQQVIDGTLSYGDLSAFLLYSMMTGFAAGNVASAYAEFRRASGASERVLRLLEPRDADAELVRTRRLELPPTCTATEEQLHWTDDLTFARRGTKTPSSSTTTTSSTPIGQIDLQSVSFAYPSDPNRLVLSDYNLNITAGERVALLGPSGCGKSTITALLAGLYEPSGGQVLIGGVDVSEMNRSHLRTELLSVVPQEPALFSGSLKENVRVGRPDASEEELRHAAQLAGCADFAGEHWERDVGERGLQLSGGQKQRVALARVLLRQTPIVLLDEFSSALDTALEERLFDSLRETLKGRTLLLITHRTSALALVDRVVELPRRPVVSQAVKLH